MSIHPYTRLFTQTLDPTVDDDIDAGYEIGDVWHTEGGSIFDCRDASAGAAIWDERGAGGGGGGAVDSVNGQTGTVVLDADDISDSSTTHKFTSASDITKLAGIAAGAEVNVNADWSAVSGDAQILNKPTIPTQYTDELAQDAVGAMIADTDTVDFTYTDATPELKADVKKQMSIISDSSGLKLSGDSATPGNNKVYGTDGSGVKGWKADPSGGSSFTPSHFVLPILVPDSNTNFATLSAVDSVGLTRWSSGAQNAELVWNINLPAGTYSIFLVHSKANNRGKYHFIFDSSDLGNIDGYDSAGSGVFTYSSLTGLTVAGGTPVVVKMKMSDKNASSSGYYGIPYQLVLVRTGA